MNNLVNTIKQLLNITHDNKNFLKPNADQL